MFSHHQRHASLTVAGLVTAALLLGSGPSAAAPAEVTKAEYKKVKKGMSQAKVRQIVQARGKVYDHYGDCLIRKYRGWGGEVNYLVYFRFDDSDDNGVIGLEEKFFTLGGTIPYCPRPTTR